MGLTVLDASVVIAVLDAGDPHHAAARAALSAHLESRDALVVPVSAYAEALVGAFRSGPSAVETVEAFLAALPASIEPATASIARRAAELRARHGRRMPLPDAFVIGTAIDLSADQVLTADRDWPDVAVAVEVVNPARD